MKYLLFIFLTVLSACSSTKREQPTPFTVTNKPVIIVGCEELKQRVAEWNLANPDKPPRKADC